ncbi:MAG TPA: DUF364 domain-containing protein [Dehalococcoidia bacterium]|nr:DUF364 domain-containing protein [Dehalococcoidia bacterium]
MKIIDDLLSTLDYEAPVREIRQGPFQTAVLTRRCGLATTLHEPGPLRDKMPIKEAGSLMEKSALGLARMVYSPSPLEATIGMATINSLLDIDEARCVELNAADLLTEKGRDKKIALVGHFPFVPKLQQVAGELWVIEREPQPGDFAESQAERLIPRAEVVGITGSAFTNHTIERLLELCPPQAYVVVLGGTTPLSPILFDYGVDAVSGAQVTDPEMVLRYVSQGATFRQLQGIRRLTMMKK